MNQRFGLFLGLMMVVSPRAMGADWMQFRGPGSLGVSDDKDVPTKWSEKENVLWKTPLPGPGGSSPIAVGDALYLTAYSGYGESATAPGDQAKLVRHLICLDRKSGKPRWTKDIPAVLPESAYKGGNDAQHGYASSTLASDGMHLFAFFGKSGVFCFDLKGEKVWSKSVGTGVTGWGSATSPLLYKDMVIVNAAVESGAMYALKKSNGDEVWKFNGTKSSWASPVLVPEVDGKSEIVISLPGSPGKIVGINPDTGVQIWESPGNSDGYICPSVVYHDGIIYAMAGRNNKSVAVKAGGKGTVTPLWTSKSDSRVNSAVYHDGHLYWYNEQKGQAFCVDAATGNVDYAERVNIGGNSYASAVYADGKVYYVSKDGTTFVVAAKPKFELLATNKLDDKARTTASPTIDNGRLLIRTDKELYCIGKK
jgi:outer membrane protein assembly factor BamB